MKVLVTGATGFIGGNLARALIRKGYEVRVLVRPQSDRRNIRDLNAEVCVGDLTDVPSLDTALKGCEGLFHVAAAYTFWSADPQSIYDSNVTGTENILNAAARAGVRKIVYTSSESTLKIPTGDASCDSYTLNDPATLPGDYKRSKCRAEQRVMELCAEGLPVVVVNPTTPVGPYDIKPTPTGSIIVNFINGKMPAFVNTGLNVIDVEDVAAGHILAMEKGRCAERYVLGNRNVTLREILVILAGITGLKAPTVNIPIWTAMAASYVDEFINGKILHRSPGIPLAAVKAARKFRHFDCSRSVTELGLPQTPIEEAFEKAVLWFYRNNYLHRSINIPKRSVA